MRYTNTGGELPLLPLLGGVTIALWLNYTNSAVGKVFSITGWADGGNIPSPGKIICEIKNGPSATLSFSFSGGTTQAFGTSIPNSWNHYVISLITGGKIIFYLNGVQQADNVNVPSSWGTSTDPKSYRFGGNVGLGCTEGAVGAVTGMTFSDWRFYNTVLTPVQIQTIYQSGGYYLASQMSMTGAPLLKLLSAQAQASVSGIFSLRAVSGVTARAVNVVPSGIPPSLMTQTGTNSSTQTLGSGGLLAGSYTASCSSSAYGNGAPGPFAGVYQYPNNNYAWQVSRYPVGGGTVSSPTTAGYNGDWLQLKTPFPINLSAYSVNYGALTSFVLLASTDESNWTLVDSNSGLSGGGTITKTGLNFAGYSYFRFIILTSTTNYPFLTDIKFNGRPAQDFYADRLGNLLTAPVTGQSLSRWLGGETGYVATWYDQSGKGKDATQTNQALRPSITQDASGRYQVDFTTNGGTSWMDLPTGTIPMQTAYTVTCHHNTIGNAKGGICGARGASGNGGSNRFRRSDTTTGYNNYWWNIDLITPTGYAPGNVVTFKFAAETSPTSGTTYVYTNGSQIYYLNRSGWVGVSGNEAIGAIEPYPNSENMNGQMYSLFLFTSALSDSDRTAVENAS